MPTLDEFGEEVHPVKGHHVTYAEQTDGDTVYYVVGSDNTLQATTSASAAVAVSDKTDKVGFSVCKY